MNKIYTDLDQLPAIFGATEVSAALAISRAAAYQLFHRSDFPVIVLGNRRLVRKEKFIEWLDSISGDTTY